MNDEMKKAAKLWIEDEIKKIEQNEIKAEWEPSLKFRIKMRWIFWKAKMILLLKKAEKKKKKKRKKSKIKAYK